MELQSVVTPTNTSLSSTDGDGSADDGSLLAVKSPPLAAHVAFAFKTYIILHQQPNRSSNSA
jgi:hypothetical protein